jgi:hypothetical protein
MKFMKEKTCQIHFRATEKEKAQYERNAQKCGLSLSEYLRKLANGYEPKALPPLNYRKIYDLLLDVYLDWRSERDPRLANFLLDIIRQMMAGIDPAVRGSDAGGGNKNLASAG